MKTLKVTKTIDSVNGVIFLLEVDDEKVSFNEAIEKLTDSDEFSTGWANVFVRRGQKVQVTFKHDGPTSIGENMTADEVVTVITNLVVAIKKEYKTKYPETLEVSGAIFL